MGRDAIRSTARMPAYYTRLQALTPNNPADGDTEAFNPGARAARQAGDTAFHAAVDTTLGRHGVVEDGTQGSVRGVVDLLTIQRAYAANLDSLRALESVLGTVVNETGDVA